MVSFVCRAQTKLRTIEVSDTILSAAVDRPGDFYIVTTHGQIQKFDKNGKLVVVFRHQGAPTLFDPRDGARLFAYYRDAQQYDYYNPSFETVASYHVNPAFAIEPWLICASGDHKLWLLDKADHSLKKLNAQHTEIEIEVVIDSTVIRDASSFTMLRDYQGFVFALNPSKGIFIFNGLGQHIRTVEVKGIGTFNFLGQELYYLQDGRVKLFDLYTAETRELPQQIDGKAVLLTDERMVVVHPNAIEIFQFTP